VPTLWEEKPRLGVPSDLATHDDQKAETTMSFEGKVALVTAGVPASGAPPLST
jgi:hypothetical protein